MVFWCVLLIAAAAILVVALNSRHEVKTSEDNEAFSLDFPKGFEEASALGKAFAMTNSINATVILNPKPADPPLSIKDAKTRLHNLSCKAEPSVTKINGQRVVTANAPEPCGLFQSTAIAYGPNHRATVFCSAPKPAQAVAACRETLAGLKLK